MKRTDLVRKLEEAGCELVRHGGNHDWYRNPKTGTLNLCPGIGSLAKHIMKKLAR
jgi:mRNA interferase HicA